ncbi:DUF1648 domain-containing protein [Caldisericum sp.]|uniref:DUF1648 domain-containing protein n=1 Tax=Caldisericum sp. TaxID=2499687 RepID=UPI003D0C7936
MKTNKLQIASAIVLLITLIVTIILFVALPEQIAIHWTKGVADKFTTRFVGAFSLIFLSSGIFILQVLISRINRAKRAFYDIFFLLVIAALSITQVFSLLWNSGYKFNISNIGGMVGEIIIGLIFISVGIFLRRTKEKIHAGVHLGFWLASSKALDDPNIRKKTNNIAGIAFEILGTILILMSFFPKLQNVLFNVVLWSTIAIVAFTYIYSSYEYQKEAKNNAKL